jgi:hypothetical protein
MPLRVSFINILDNIGGRLLLEYYLDDNNEKFWLFYLDTHLHHIGWARNNSNYEYKSPVDVVERV